MFPRTAPERADAAGGLLPTTAESAFGLPVTAEPVPAAQTPPVSWFGLQTKKLTLPVGVPPMLVPVTTALSNRLVPRATPVVVGFGIGTPEPSVGVVTVLV